MWALFEERLLRRVLDNGAVKARLAGIERDVASGALSAEAGAEQIMICAGLAP